MSNATKVAAFLGWVFMACSMAGALIPGLCFHVHMDSNESALEWHQEQVDKLKARAAKKGKQ